MSNTLGRKCSFCKTDNWWSIDNKYTYTEICDNCKKSVNYNKDISNYCCPSCSSTNITVKDNDNDFSILCNECGNIDVLFTKHFVMFDNRFKDNVVIKNKQNQTKNYTPKCPICQSPNIQKLSISKRAVHGLAFGLFSKTARSQWECKDCGNKW